MSMPRVAPVLLLAACANAGGSSPPIDARPTDAPRVDGPLLVDAPPSDGPPSDAPVLVDAPLTDAPDTGLFCTANSQCTVAGECCIKLTLPQGICGPGTVFLGECIPE